MKTVKLVLVYDEDDKSKRDPYDKFILLYEIDKGYYQHIDVYRIFQYGFAEKMDGGIIPND